MPPRAADKFVKRRSQKRDVESLRRALAAMADLEVETPRRRAQRGHRGGPRGRVAIADALLRPPRV